MPIKNVNIGKNVKFYCDKSLLNLYGCEIGDNTKIGAFVEIQAGAKIGKNCKVQSHSFICDGVTLEDEVFIGHGVMFTNDRFPKCIGPWKLEKTLVKKKAIIGTGSSLMCGITIGEGAIIGIGSVVTKNVPPGEIWAGNPARKIK